MLKYIMIKADDIKIYKKKIQTIILIYCPSIQFQYILKLFYDYFNYKSDLYNNISPLFINI